MRNDAFAGLVRGPFCIVEVGTEWVKVAKVRNGAVETVAATTFDPVKGDGSAALRTLVEQHRLTGLPAIALVPRQSVNIRMLDLPSQDVAEIRDMVDLQATKQTPYTREEVLVDHSAAASDRAGYTHVVLVIVQRAVLRHRYYLLEEAGLKLAKVSVSSEALLYWARLAVPSGEETVAVLDVDAGSSEIAIVGPAGLLFSRAILTGSDHLAGGDPKFVERLVDEVRRGMDVVRGEVRDLVVGRLALTGSVPAEGGLSERLSQVLDMPCVHRESLSVVGGTPAKVNGPAGRRFSLTAIAGAAASPGNLAFNLIPESVLARQTVAARGSQLAAMAAMIMAAMVLGSLAAMVRFQAGRQRLSELDEMLTSKKQAVERTERRQEIIEVVRHRQSGRRLPLEVLRDIGQVLPQGVSLESVDLNKEQGQVTIAGTAPALKDIRGMVGNLEQSGLLRDVREGNATTLDKSQRYRFQLVAAVEKTP